MRNKLVIALILGLFLISSVSAVCTLTFDKPAGTNYSQLETVTATMSCSAVDEKNKAYTINWTNGSGDNIHYDAGITPILVNVNFFETFTIPADYVSVNGTTLSASMNGTNLEGFDIANISSAGTNDLIIQKITTTSQILIGKEIGIHFELVDENTKKINNAKCLVEILDSNLKPTIISNPIIVIDGEGGFSTGQITATFFNEGQDYSFRIHCFCGVVNTSLACWDEDGASVTNSDGTATFPFSINIWLETNTLTNKNLYEMKEEIFICANITNVNFSSRIPLHIYSQIRCSKGVDNNDDLDRILIAFSSHIEPQVRGINPGATQMHCEKFIIPELKYLMGRNSECYASSDVWALDNLHSEILGYHTISPVFNITSNEINIEPDWQWVSDTTLNSIVNLSDSKLNDINGTGMGNLDLRLYMNDVTSLQTSLEIFNLISNITVKNTTSTLIEHSDYELEFLEDGYIEIELRDVTLAKGGADAWWNITLDFYDLGLRDTVALEGIESKTGTFHMDVNCPSYGEIGGDIDCVITAQIEDSQTVEKEVDFTCYIIDNGDIYSSVNFNQMITRNPVNIVQSFPIPSTFKDTSQYVVQCYGDYYNLGKRRDSFYDTFTTRGWISGAGGQKGLPSITGEVVDEGEGIPTVISKNYLYFILFIIVIFLIILFMRKKQFKKDYFECLKKKKGWEIFIKIFFVFLILLIITCVLFGLFYGFKLIKNINFGTDTVEQSETSYPLTNSYSILQDKLFRGIILTGFIVLMIIILFRFLNLRGEVRFGYDKNYYEDRKYTKMQNRLNRMLVEGEIKRQKNKKNYKVKKMSAEEFAKRINNWERN